MVLVPCWNCILDWLMGPGFIPRIDIYWTMLETYIYAFLFWLKMYWGKGEGEGKRERDVNHLGYYIAMIWNLNTTLLLQTFYVCTSLLWVRIVFMWFALLCFSRKQKQLWTTSHSMPQMSSCCQILWYCVLEIASWYYSHNGSLSEACVTHRFSSLPPDLSESNTPKPTVYWMLVICSLRG